MVFLIIFPSCPFNPTVASAAKTLCIAIIFPIAPPTTCNDNKTIKEIPSDFAISAWKLENNKFETVLLPAINAPKLPIKGAIII